MKKTFAAALCALLLSAQAPNDPSRITVEVFRANFLMTVTDKKGRFVDENVQARRGGEFVSARAEDVKIFLL